MEDGSIVGGIALRHIARAKVKVGLAQSLGLRAHAQGAQMRRVVEGKAGLGIFGIDAIGEIIYQRAQQGAFGGQGFLRALALGDVVEYSLQHFPSLEIQQAGFDLHFSDFTRRGKHLRLQYLTLLIGHVLLECWGKSCVIAGGGVQNGLMLPDQFCPMSARQIRECLVAVQQDTRICVGQRDAIPGCLKQCTILFLTLPQRLLRLLALGDVAGNAKRANDSPFVVTQWHLGSGDPTHVPIGPRFFFFFTHQRLTGSKDGLFIFVGGAGVFFREKVKVCLADGLRRIAQAKPTGQSLVDPGKATLCVLEVNSVWKVVYQRAEQSVFFCQRLLCLLAFGDVQHDALPIQRAAGAIAHHDRLVANPYDTPIAGDQAIFQLECLARGVGADMLCQHALAVIGMEQPGPESWVGHPLFRRVARHGFDLRADVYRRTGLVNGIQVNDGRNLLYQRAVSGLGFAQRRFRSLLLFAQELVFQSVAHRLTQPRRAVLEHIIIGPLAHDFDRRLLADAAGKDDEGNVQAALFHQLQRASATKVWQRPVGQDQVEGRFERGHIVRLIVHTPPGKLKTLFLQAQDHQLGVIEIVFDDQDTQWCGHLKLLLKDEG